MIQELARYWATDYDWRTCEAKLNALPHFMTEIDGLGIHFIHVRSGHDDALPLIVTHGWPGSIIEQLKIIDPLTNPTAHGAAASDAFHLWGANTPSWRLTCDVLSQPNCHVESALAITGTSGITEKNTAGLSWVHKRSIRGPRPLRARRGGSYGPLPSIERSRTQVSAQPLDHLPGYGDDVPVVV